MDTLTIQKWKKIASMLPLVLLPHMAMSWIALCSYHLLCYYSVLSIYPFSLYLCVFFFFSSSSGIFGMAKPVPLRSQYLIFIMFQLTLKFRMEIIFVQFILPSYVIQANSRFYHLNFFRFVSLFIVGVVTYKFGYTIC